MKSVLVIVAAISCSLLLVFAQNTPSGTSSTSSMSSMTGSGGGSSDDHNDNGPIQVGYAIVTPSTFSTNGTSNLVVFETFGLRQLGGTTQAGVIPPNLTTDALLFVDSEGALQKNVGVAIVNPNSSSENVTLTLRDNTGKTLGSTTITVPSTQQVSKFVTELFANQASVPKDVTGTLSVTSTDPVSVIGLRFRGENFSTLPLTNMASTGTVPSSFGENIGGPGAVLLPQFAAGGGWATELVIVNNGTTTMTVRVDLFTSTGTALSTKLNNQPAASSYPSISIPAGGVYVLAPRDSDGDDDF